MKTLMLGNEAAARGLYEAGCAMVSSYPGTPSTEITEFAAKYEEIYAEWAPNEKVAMEAAFGAALAGRRSFCGMKHVGLNVAADPSVYHFLYRRKRRHGHRRSGRRGDAQLPERAGFPPLCHGRQDPHAGACGFRGSPGLCQAGLYHFRAVRHPGAVEDVHPGRPRPEPGGDRRPGRSRPRSPM